MQCGTPIYWPPKASYKPTSATGCTRTCGACKLAQVTAAREAAREALRHPQLPRARERSAPPATPEGSGSGG